jgi:hypothetical protein
MLIYVNGCSHSIGIDKTAYSWSHVLGKSICRDINYINNIGLSELDIINTTHNVLYNFSDSSKGNDLIFFETIEFLNKCKNQNVIPDYVFVQWSGPSRFAKQVYDGSIELYNPGDDDIELFSFEPFASNRTLYFISALQDILTRMKIEYSFACYMDLDRESGNSETYKSIDLSKFISFDETTHPLFDGFRNPMRIKGYIVDGNGHPSFFGHWFLANKFLEKLKLDNSDYGFFESLDDYDIKTKLSPIEMIMFYRDSMLQKDKVKSMTLKNKLIEGGEIEKNDIRKSIL